MDTNTVSATTTDDSGEGYADRVLDRAEAFLSEAFSFEVVDRCTGICPMCDTGRLAHAA